MTNPQNNGRGVKEVATPQMNTKAEGNKTAVSPAAETPAVEIETKEAIAAAPRPKTLDEQIQFFLGLEKLVNIRRRFETHLNTVQALEINDEDLTKFETGNRYGVGIELHGSNGSEYRITNPRLVQEMRDYLISVLQGKINEYNGQIMTYEAVETTKAA